MILSWIFQWADQKLSQGEKLRQWAKWFDHLQLGLLFSHKWKFYWKSDSKKLPIRSNKDNLWTVLFPLKTVCCGYPSNHISDSNEKNAEKYPIIFTIFLSYLALRVTTTAHSLGKYSTPFLLQIFRHYVHTLFGFSSALYQLSSDFLLTAL